MKNWFSIKAQANSTEASPAYAISIHDEIGFWGVTATEFLSQLGAIPRDAKIELSINSPGGDVFDGLAIYNALKARRPNIEAHVVGTACSMASVILMAAGKRIVPENAYLMVHGITGLCYGSIADMREQAAVMEALESTLASMYMEATGQDESTVKGWMSTDTWFDGKQALEAGLCDEVVATLPLAACASASALKSYNTAPDSVKQLFAVSDPADVAPVPAESEPVDPVVQPSDEGDTVARLAAVNRCLTENEPVLAQLLSSNAFALSDLDARIERAAGIRALAATAQYPKADELIANNSTIAQAQTVISQYLQSKAPVVQGAQASGNDIRLPQNQAVQKSVAEAVNVAAVYAARNSNNQNRK